MKTKILPFIFSLVLSFSLSAQSFVNPSNTWYVDDCCVDQSNGMLHCFTFYYELGAIAMIDNKEYRELKSSLENPLFASLDYLREEGRSVYGKKNASSAEFLMYDFSASIGQKLELGDNNKIMVEVMAIDSIELNSGEKRKRMQVGLEGHLEFNTYWIEGIGSELWPLNTQYMFTFDCWNDLNCFQFDGVPQYSLKDCELDTSTKEASEKENLVVFPNPTSGDLQIRSHAEGIKRVKVLDLTGKLIQTHEQPGRDFHLDLSAFPDAVVFLAIEFSDGRSITEKVLVYQP